MAYRVTVQSEGEAIQAAKALLRSTLVATRRARSAAEFQTARDANTVHLRAALSGRTCVAAYLPLPSEPLDPAFLDEVARTSRVLIPVVTGAFPLDWCEHPGPVRQGSFGIDEPTGPRLGIAAILQADAILVPALAVDVLGHRLGRGGGHYDRTLALFAELTGSTARAATALPLRVAVLHDNEFPVAVPFDRLDQPVSAVVTPARGVQMVS